METPNEPPGDPSQRRPAVRRRRAPTSGGGADPKTAGFLIVAVIIAVGGAGLGLGALVGLPAPFGLAGVLVGLALGLRLVYARFRDI